VIRPASSPNVVTLTSDFGLTDPYVGMVRGVILGRNPAASVIDLTHAVPAQSIDAGAFVLAHSYRFFPMGAVHWAVVDPGVGTARRALLLQTRHAWFVGPDNGIFALVLDRDPCLRCWVLDRTEHWQSPVSTTFHGRDIFAPIAALCALGVDPDTLGTRMTDSLPVGRSLSYEQRSDGTSEGCVVWVDHFGNLITSLPASLLSERRWKGLLLNGSVAPIVHTYGEARDASIIALKGSSGFLEVAVPNGNASLRLRVSVGASVVLVPDMR